MKNILVVDDASMIREMLKGILEAEGYNVTTAADGEEALEVYKSQTIDLSIIDIFLPKKGGLQVMGELVKHDPDCKFIAISGGEAFNPQQILELANSSFEVAETFAKPIDTHQMLMTVKRLLEE